MSAYQERVVPFVAGDGLALNLINIRNPANISKGPILLVHGAGVRANLFRAPIPQTLVDALIAAGYDVWLENWRASIDFQPNQWTLEQAALYDHPYAVKIIVKETGIGKIKAIIHCQGSTSFMMALVSGLLPQVSTVLSNAVSLHPVVPLWSRKKLLYVLPLVKLMTAYMNPHWGVKAPGLSAKFLVALTRMTHRECNNTCCRLVSFTYGSGYPALWSHENLNDETHDWLCNEFKHVPMSFFSEMRRFVQRGYLFNHEAREALPKDFISQKPQTDARIIFYAGEDNLCFLPQSQAQTFHYFNSIEPDKHELHLIPNYGHLDMFFGKKAYIDIFPGMIKSLDRD